MKPLHRRVIDLTYWEDKLPTFSSNEEMHEYHRALGRMVMYGLQREAEHSTLQLVRLYLEPDEITGAYQHPLPDEGTTESRTTQALEALRTDRAFVMGAVKHGDKFGFHS